MVPGMLCIVDDDPLMHFTIKKLVKSVAPQTEILSFSDGTQACEYLRKNIANKDQLPDIILLDLHTPYMSGVKFLEHFAGMRPSIERDISIYVFSSTIDKEEIEVACTYPGVKGYINKPVSKVNIEEILNAINKIA